MAFKISKESVVEVISKVFLMFYWLFDNSSILSKLKILNFDIKNQTKIASTAWFLGTLFSAIKFIMDLNKLMIERSNEDPNNKNVELDKKIFNVYLNIIGKIGDLFPSAQGAEIPHRLLGKGFDETLCGIGGLISALIAIRNAWK